VRIVFADTSFFIALAIPRDRLHDLAQAVYEHLLEDSSLKFMTSEPVLTEVLTRLTKYGPQARVAAVRLAIEVREDARFTVVPQTSALFQDGLDLFRRRPDKAYSMTDCMSMEICRTRAISEILTADHDFEQERFTILLKR
jgi:predicted nucleic acid-binding protein